MIVTSAKGLDARPLNTGTQDKSGDKSSRPVVMVQPTLHTTVPTSVPVKSMHIITKCGEDLYKDSQPSAVASKTPTTTTQGTSMFSDSYQHLKIIVNGKVQNYLVPVKKPSSAESEPVIAYGPFDFLGGKMTSAAVNVNQSGSAATSVKYPDSRPASTNKSSEVENRVSPTGAVSISLGKPILTQNTTANQLPPKPDLLANKPAAVTTKHSAGTPASTSFVNLVSIFPSTSCGTDKAQCQVPVASNVLAAYQQNTLSRSSDKPESSSGTLHSTIGSLMSRPAKSTVPKPCNMEAAPSIRSSVSEVQGKATALNLQNTGLEIGGTLVKRLSKITFNVKDPTSSMAEANSYTGYTGTTCSKVQNKIVAVKDAAGNIIGFKNVEQNKHTGVSVPSQGAGAVAVSSSAMRPFQCVPTIVSSYSTAVPKVTTVHLVNVPFQQKPSEVSDSQHSLKIDSVYSLAKPTPVTMKRVKTDTSVDSGAPGPSLSACDKDSTANSSHLVPEQPTFLEVIDVVPCKVVMRKISQNFPTKVTKKNVNKLGTFNIRKRPWSKLVREHLSSYYRAEKFAKIDLNPENVYRILQESPLTVVAMPRKAVQTDQTDDTVKDEHKPQTARKRGYGRINISRNGKIDSLPKKRYKKSSENNEDPVRLSRPRPLLMSALRSTSPLTDRSAAKSIAASQPTECSVAKSTAPRQSSISSVAKSTETRQMPMVSATQSKATHQTPVFSVTQSTATSKMPVCSVVHVTSAAALCPPKYKSIINPAVVSPTKGIINPTILPSNKGVVNPSIMSHEKCVNSPNALKPVQHQTPAPVSQENKERSSVCRIVPALSEMCDETKKVSLPFGPCVTAGFTGKAVLGKEGSEPENYLILKTSQSCYFVPVGKNAYVVPISKATEVVQSSEKPVMSTACFGDVTSVSESRAMKVASQVTTMPILTAEAGAPRMTMKATRYHDIGKTDSPKTDDTRSQTSSPRKKSRDGDSSGKSGTNSVSYSGVRVKAEPITTGYPGDPENEPPRLSPAPSPIPGVWIKTENDWETDDAWSGTDMPNDEAPVEEEAPCVPFKSVADLYRSRQDHGQYQPTVNYQATGEDDEAKIRAERIRKLRELMKSKEKKCDKARQTWSGDQTERLIKEFDDI